ncbi:ergosterol biosynthesis protein [Saxophila tyrrhenica]|uniref:Ergosterol biosynthesis protein n=1 Tax=Saxophila tyrrhenica TaxID=1690608 RepID=A0AAV9P6B2_9PEZI|nr:ergosterol biosynthesis protein [Saxophila tyrrhenica]
MASFLPPAEGLLPKWLLFISVVSIANSVQAYVSLKGTREVYAGSAPQSMPKDIPKRTVVAQESSSPVTPLSARTFGTWTALSSIIRLYGAYNIHDKLVYELCIWTYLIAFAHFSSELFFFKSARVGRGIAAPMAVATGTLTWMLLQWGAYVK